MSCGKGRVTRQRSCRSVGHGCTGTNREVKDCDGKFGSVCGGKSLVFNISIAIVLYTTYLESLSISVLSPNDASHFLNSSFFH